LAKMRSKPKPKPPAYWSKGTVSWYSRYNRSGKQER